MLRLRIENFDQLPDGGPLEFSVESRGFDFGRDQHLDWTLPDPSGVISRKHCEVRFFEQFYWLFDLSTNGAFLNKSSKRLQSPYKLKDGDELRIGEYIISVSISRPPNQSQPFEIAADQHRPQDWPQSPPQGNIWSSNEEPAPPIDPRDLMPPAPEIRRAPDYLNRVVQLPPIPEVAPPPRRQSPSPSDAPASEDIWSQSPVRQRREEQPLSPALSADIFQSSELPFQPAAPMYEAVPMPAAAPQSIGRAESARSAGSQDFIAAFATGAGISPDTLSGRNPAELAEELGSLFKLFCDHMMQLLSARASAKTVSRSSNRTIIRPTDNNPLKFMPTAEEALRVMLGQKSPSYLDARETIERSFADIKSHQLATLSAMQRAVQSVLEGLSPEDIKALSEGAKKSVFGSSKSQLWDLYTQAWAAKAGNKEYGMLTAFLDAFAVYYDQESNKTK